MRRGTVASSAAFGVAVQVAAWIAACLWVAPAAQAQLPLLPADVQRGPSVEGINEYQLANGLKVLLFADRSRSTATVNITYAVGSKHENYGEAGMAHLLEHLVFRGTPTYRDIPQELVRRGMRWNGTTYFDRTNYFESFDSSEEKLEFALRLEADRMVNSFIARADLDSEMTVVRNEMERAENDAGRILQQRLEATAYLWHNYGRSVLGARSDVENVNIDRLQAFYRQYYQPDNAVLVVAGNFDEARTLERIAEIFGPIPRPRRVLPSLYTVEPTQDGERSVTLRRVGDRQIVAAAYHIPAITHPDAPALSLLSYLMTFRPAGRLYKALVQTRKATSANAGIGLLRDPGLLTFSATLAADGDLNAVQNELLATIESAAGTPFTTEEFQRAQREILLGFERLMQSPERVAILLSESIGQGDWRMLLVSRQRVSQATLADVERVAATYLKPANRTLGLFIPAERPDRAPIGAAPSATELADTFDFSQAMAEGEPITLSAEGLEARTRRLTLPSGIKLAMLPKENRGHTVTVAIQLRWARYEDVHLASGSTFVAPLLFEGTSNRSRQRIQDDLIALKSRININGGPQGATINITSQRGQLLSALAVMEDLLKNPTFDPAGFERMKSQRLAGLVARRREPATLLADARAPYLNAQRNITSDQPRYIRTTAENIARLEATQLDDARKFHADFWGARDVQVAAVGSLPEGFEVALDDALGDWKRAVPAFERHIAGYVEVAGKRFDVQAADKASGLLDIDHYFSLTQDDAAYWPLLLANRMFGGAFLHSRLSVRVRRQEGLSYGINSRLNVGYWDERSSFGVTGTSAPENLDRMAAAVSEEIDRARRDGFTPAELDDAKSGLLADYRRARANDATLTSDLLRHLDRDTTFAEWTENEARLHAVTVADANRAFVHYIDPQRFLFGLSGDFTRK